MYIKDKRKFRLIRRIKMPKQINITFTYEETEEKFEPLFSKSF